MTARRPCLKKRDLETAYAFAAEHGLGVRALRVAGDGSFSLDFGNPDHANDDAVDRELAALEARHGKGGA